MTADFRNNPTAEKIEKPNSEMSKTQTKFLTSAPDCTSKKPISETTQPQKRLVRQRRTVCVSCVLPREPANETENVFERKKAPKRNVATRQPARDVRRNCDEQLCFDLSWTANFNSRN